MFLRCVVRADRRFLDTPDNHHSRHIKGAHKRERQTAVHTGQPARKVAERRRKRDGGGHNQGVDPRAFLRVDIQLEQSVLARVHQRAADGRYEHIEYDAGQIADRSHDQKQDSQRVQSQPDPHGDPEFHGAQAVLDRDHEDQHHRRVEDREQRKVVIGKAQPLGGVQAEKIRADKVGDIQDDRHGNGFQYAFVLQQLGDQLAVFAQHMQGGNVFGFGHADFSLPRFGAEFIGDEGFCQHRQGEDQVQHVQHRHDGVGVDEQPRQRREEDGDQTADIHPGIQPDEILRIGVLDEQTVPRGLIDLLEAVEDSGGQKEPEVVGDGPDQAGHRPAEEIAHHGGEFPSHFVGENPAEKGKEHLHEHGDRQNQADLHVRDPLVIHIQCGERRDQVVGDAPQRFNQHQCPGIPPVVCQKFNQRVILQPFQYW